MTFVLSLEFPERMLLLNKLGNESLLLVVVSLLVTATLFQWLILCRITVSSQLYKCRMAGKVLQNSGCMHISWRPGLFSPAISFLNKLKVVERRTLLDRTRCPYSLHLQRPTRAGFYRSVRRVRPGPFSFIFMLFSTAAFPSCW